MAGSSSSSCPSGPATADRRSPKRFNLKSPKTISSSRSTRRWVATKRPGAGARRKRRRTEHPHGAAPTARRKGGAAAAHRSAAQRQRPWFTTPSPCSRGSWCSAAAAAARAPPSSPPKTANDHGQGAPTLRRPPRTAGAAPGTPAAR